MTNNKILQGSIWWVDLENNPVGHEQGERRPFFVISKGDYNTRSKTPIGYTMSTSLHKSNNAFSVQITYNDSQQEKKQGYVNVSQIRTLSIDRFGNSLGRVLERKDVYKVLNHFNKQIIAN